MKSHVLCSARSKRITSHGGIGTNLRGSSKPNLRKLHMRLKIYSHRDPLRLHGAYQYAAEGSPSQRDLAMIIVDGTEVKGYPGWLRNEEN